MWKATILLTVTILTLLLSTCSSYSDTEEPLKIGITSWVGYYPIFYAYEKGWLEKNNIELTQMASLYESTRMYKHGYINIMLGTQYEYNILSKKHKSMKIIKFLDRSNGGDIIMSNRTIKELQNSKLIEVYLEVNSVNRLLLLDFMKKYKIQREQVKLININQDYIDSLALSKSNKSIAIITYNPYNYKHNANGFVEIISTKDNDLLIVDILFARSSVLNNHKNQIKTLKILIDEAIEISKNNPDDFFNVVSKVLPTSREEYETSIGSIKWININRSDELTNNLKSRNLIEF
ncbi:MAG: hypothetical protein DRH57_09145 [Candidatus Cloacimonadota bacterium]|nr:MAG: hypothetical protein DRH57_09145 [Candidatus Cloacimonadota bacterium]